MKTRYQRVTKHRIGFLVIVYSVIYNSGQLSICVMRIISVNSNILQHYHPSIQPDVYMLLDCFLTRLSRQHKTPCAGDSSLLCWVLVPTNITILSLFQIPSFQLCLKRTRINSQHDAWDPLQFIYEELSETD